MVARTAAACQPRLARGRRSAAVLWDEFSQRYNRVVEHDAGTAMPPTTAYDFMKAGLQRFIAAEELLRAKLTLDAQYLGGYAVECALKALILHVTPENERADKLKRITSGASMHRPEILLGELRNRDVVLPLALTKRIRNRRFGWTTDLRYETGRRDTGETIAFLKTAKAVYDWVQEQLP